MQSSLHDVECSVSEFVALCNQTFEYAFPGVVIVGELANLRVSKNRWVYFDLKDEDSTVKFFGTVYQLPGPLEDGMMLKVRGQPKLHNQYGFSVNVMNIQPAGEGSIKQAAKLLQLKLQKEGLFDDSRKRPIPYPPTKIGLVASKQSAAYADFIKILQARWQGVEIQLIDVQVQGEIAPAQIVGAINQFNIEAETPDVIVLIRGGGSPEDLAAFSTENVTRAVASSRVPTLVAIGHEIDLSLAELAADRRASTPSNAAELLVPDKLSIIESLVGQRKLLHKTIDQILESQLDDLGQSLADIDSLVISKFKDSRLELRQSHKLIKALSPDATLKRGYAIVRYQDKPVRMASQLSSNAIVEVQLSDGGFEAKITQVKDRK